jgi:hypothetical protein
MKKDVPQPVCTMELQTRRGEAHSPQRLSGGMGAEGSWGELSTRLAVCPQKVLEFMSSSGDLCSLLYQVQGPHCKGTVSLTPWDDLVCQL